MYEGRLVKGHRPIITLTTDFGLKDPFAGIMKGVIAGINPNAVIIDLSHEVFPQDIRGAAFILSISAPYFPAGTVHAVVVDPGVGGDRRPLAIRAGTSFFVGPDNGVLSWAFRDSAPVAVRRIIRPEYAMPTVSATFHGRDVFAPAAAHLSAGVPIERLGPAVDDPVLLPFPLPETGDGEIRGEILYIDRFGNLTTNVRSEAVKSVREIIFGDARIGRVSKSYDEGRRGELIVLPASSGFLEIAVNLGNAERQTGARIGDPVSVLL